MKNVKFPSIKKELGERELHSREIRKTIRASSGMSRWVSWQDKRHYGRDTRHLLLAYGMVRGLPYLACEAKCGEFNRPSSSAIAAHARAHGIELDLEVVKAWLKREACAGEASVAA